MLSGAQLFPALIDVIHHRRDDRPERSNGEAHRVLTEWLRERR
jgi:hypothetical protein